MPRRKTDPNRDGALVLTFVNMGSQRRSPRPRDYGELLTWAGQHDALDDSEAQRLGRLAADRPEDAATSFALAEEFHQSLHETMHIVAEYMMPPAPKIERLNGLLARVLPPRILAPDRFSMCWRWPDREDDLLRPLWAVALSATELLTSEDFAHVKCCALEGCDVLFLAKGSGIPRKWCSDVCGSSFRSRRYYQTVVHGRKR